MEENEVVTRFGQAIESMIAKHLAGAKIARYEYSEETNQLTIYDTEGAVHRLVIVQIN